MPITIEQIPDTFPVNELVEAATLVKHPDKDSAISLRDTDIAASLVSRQALIAKLLGSKTPVTEAVWVEHREGIKLALINKFPALGEVLDGLYTFRRPDEGGPLIEKEPAKIRKLYALAAEVLGGENVSLN